MHIIVIKRQEPIDLDPRIMKLSKKIFEYKITILIYKFFIIKAKNVINKEEITIYVTII